MADKTYWEGRQEKKYLAGEKQIQQYYKDLEKSFEQSKDEIQSIINNFYVRYADENGVSFTAAQKSLSNTEIGSLKAFINKVNASMGKYDQELNNISIKARITRYQALLKQIDATLQQLYSIEYEYKGRELLKDVYSDSYYRTWYNIDVFNGFHSEYAQINPGAVEELINYPFNGADFSSRIWKQKDHMLQMLSESITTMIVQGKNPNTLSKDFAKKFSTKEFEAYRLLHTEGSFIIEQASQRAYQEDGVEKYQWLATLDLKTCELCRPLDGKVFDVGKGIVGETLTPRHMFCRCTTVPYYDDVLTDESETRIARDPVTGKNYEIPANMTYKQWEDKYIIRKTQKEYNEIIGIKSSEGTKILSISDHAIDRAIERNVSSNDTREALIEPLKTGKIKLDEEGRPSQKYVGEKATVSINPDTGVIIQVNPTSSKYAVRLKKRRD